MRCRVLCLHHPFMKLQILKIQKCFSFEYITLFFTAQTETTILPALPGNPSHCDVSFLFGPKENISYCSIAFLVTTTTPLTSNLLFYIIQASYGSFIVSTQPTPNVLFESSHYCGLSHPKKKQTSETKKTNKKKLLDEYSKDFYCNRMPSSLKLKEKSK